MEYFNDYSPWIRFSDIQWENKGLDPFLKRFSQDEIICYQQQFSDFVYLIKEGRVRIFVYGIDGDEQCLTIEEKGSLFGELSAIDGLPHFSSATAIVDCMIYEVPKKYFLKRVHADPEIMEILLQSLTKKIRVLSANILNLTLKNSHQRVATYLLKLAHSHGHIVDNTCKLSMKFTHQEMAHLTGLNRVTVSNIMSDLINKAIIHKTEGYVVIKDLEKLCLLANE